MASGACFKAITQNRLALMISCHVRAAQTQRNMGEPKYRAISTPLNFHFIRANSKNPVDQRIPATINVGHVESPFRQAKGV